MPRRIFFFNIRCSLPVLWGLCSLSVMGLGCLSAEAAEPLEYNRDVRPILADKCFACHGADSAAREAGLRLDDRDEAVEMGAIEPGDVDASEMVARILSEDHDLLMPPPEIKKPMTEEEIAILKRWIAEGAEYEAHWSFLPPERPELPSVQNTEWIKSPIDAFVLSKLEQMGLTPAEQADPYTLIRRLHLDITGLPPQPELVQQFVSEFEAEGDRVWSRWIDRLMKSPAWGEHQARYWLDAARYGDTHGLHFDNYREMWPYRDWVIRAFNKNQPFDQFTVEQIAGDLLPEPSIDQLIATGFQRCNITTNEGGTIAEENLALYAADRVQTLGWVYLGLTTNCAQCHDHKFDPMTMQDYYSLAAFFRNTTQGAFDGNVRDGKGPVIRVPSMEDQPRWNELPGEIAEAKQRKDQRREDSLEDFRNWLAEQSASDAALEAQVSEAHLVAHALMIGGSGKDVTNLVSGQPLKAAGEVAWIDSGKYGPAPQLRQTGTFEVGDVGDFEQDQSFSFGAWVKPTRLEGAGAILARMDQSQDHRGWDLWVENGAVAVHLIHSWPGDALKVVTRKPVLEKDSWQHVFVTYDGSGKPNGVKIYVDGKRYPVNAAAESLQAGSSIRADTPLRIGRRSEAQSFEETAVQDVRVYARLLPKAEVRTLATTLPLAALLSLAPDDADPANNDALRNYFLTQRDSQYMKLDEEVRRLEAEKAEIEKRSPITHIQKEKMDSAPVANLLLRGEYDQVGDEVHANTPAFLPPLIEGQPANRMGLAFWIVDSRNPLTARVTVNRYWQQLFGQGIVVTPEDFGVSGSMPSHPELLDWLAVDFQENDWDVKRLFKEILMSATYRQAALHTEEKLEKDPDNQWLSRGPRFRLDGEVIRDYALAGSGLLSKQMYGAPVKPYQPVGIWDVVGLPGGDTRDYQQGEGQDLYRRSLYTFWKRMAPPPNLEVFNAPSREVCSVARERTNTPLQALVTLNDVQFVEAARVLAQRALSKASSGDQAIDDSYTLEWIAWQVLCRPLTVGEQAVLLTSKDQFVAYYEENADDARQLNGVGESPVDEELNSVQLAAWTMVCNQLFNLDETLNK